MQTYYIFLQETENSAFENVGSVHAVDAEMALQNGRDVYARRVPCFALWAVPADAVLMRTQQQLAAEPLTVPQKDSARETYLVCVKRKPADPPTLAAQVDATCLEDALTQARSAWQAAPEPFWWWVFPRSAVIASTPEDHDPFFAAAESKPFRESAYYRVIGEIRRIQREGEK
ncbi:MAG: hypothetical protein OHK0052_18670 [Anaerolineales bacterium]